MIKISEFIGTKGFWHLVYAEGYYSNFTFKLKFKDKSKDVLIENVKEVFCIEDNIIVEVFANDPCNRDYKFKLLISNTINLN